LWVGLALLADREVVFSNRTERHWRGVHDQFIDESPAYVAFSKPFDIEIGVSFHDYTIFSVLTLSSTSGCTEGRVFEPHWTAPEGVAWPIIWCSICLCGIFGGKC
jgi:hypothetical protein